MPGASGEYAALMAHLAEAGALGHRRRMCRMTRRSERIHVSACGFNWLPYLCRSDHGARIHAGEWHCQVNG